MRDVLIHSSIREDTGTSTYKKMNRLILTSFSYAMVQDNVKNVTFVSGHFRVLRTHQDYIFLHSDYIFLHSENIRITFSSIQKTLGLHFPPFRKHQDFRNFVNLTLFCLILDEKGHNRKVKCQKCGAMSDKRNQNILNLSYHHKIY